MHPDDEGTVETLTPWSYQPFKACRRVSRGCPLCIKPCLDPREHLRRVAAIGLAVPSSDLPREIGKKQAPRRRITPYIGTGREALCVPADPNTRYLTSAGVSQRLVGYSQFMQSRCSPVLKAAPPSAPPSRLPSARRARREASPRRRAPRRGSRARRTCRPAPCAPARAAR